MCVELSCVWSTRRLKNVHNLFRQQFQLHYYIIPPIFGEHYILLL